MRYLTRGLVLLGLIAALMLLLAKGAPVTVALAKGAPVTVARATGVLSSVSPIGLGFNYTNSTSIMVVYAGTGTPAPAPSVPMNGATYYAAAMLPAGLTGSSNSGGNVMPDAGSHGSLYVYVQSSTPCAQCAFGPMGLKFTLGDNAPDVMVVYAPSGSIPSSPANYSDSALSLGSGITATYDGTNLTAPQRPSGSLYLFLQCQTVNVKC